MFGYEELERSRGLFQRPKVDMLRDVICRLGVSGAGDVGHAGEGN
jgi:hypothetical protein